MKLFETSLFEITIINKEAFQNKEENSCIVYPNKIFNSLDENTKNEIRGHINNAIDLIRDNVKL